MQLLEKRGGDPDFCDEKCTDRGIAYFSSWMFSSKTNAKATRFYFVLGSPFYLGLVHDPFSQTVVVLFLEMFLFLRGKMDFIMTWRQDALQGDPKKMSHSVLQLKSAVGVQSYFFRGVSESEFRARSN